MDISRFMALYKVLLLIIIIISITCLVLLKNTIHVQLCYTNRSMLMSTVSVDLLWCNYIKCNFHFYRFLTSESAQVIFN